MRGVGSFQDTHRLHDNLPKMIDTASAKEEAGAPAVGFKDLTTEALDDPEFLTDGFGETFYHFYEFYQFYGFYGFYMEEHDELPDLPLTMDTDFQFYDVFYEFAPQEVLERLVVPRLAIRCERTLAQVASHSGFPEEMPERVRCVFGWLSGNREKSGLNNRPKGRSLWGLRHRLCGGFRSRRCAAQYCISRPMAQSSSECSLLCSAQIEEEQAIMQLCMIAISPAVGPESGGTAVTLQLAGQIFPGHTDFYCKFGSQVAATHRLFPTLRSLTMNFRRRFCSSAASKAADASSGFAHALAELMRHI